MLEHLFNLLGECRSLVRPDMPRRKGVTYKMMRRENRFVDKDRGDLPDRAKWSASFDPNAPQPRIPRVPLGGSACADNSRANDGVSGSRWESARTVASSFGVPPSSHASSDATRTKFSHSRIRRSPDKRSRPENADADGMPASLWAPAAR